MSENLARVLEVIEEVARTPRRDAPAMERRRTVRVQCRQPMAWRRGGSVFPATALDASLGGMRLHLGSSVSAGEEIELLKDTSAASGVRARVAWFDRGSGMGGVEFVASELVGSWVLELLQSLFREPSGMVNRRRYLRVEAKLPALLDGQPGTLVDLGLGGGLLEASRAVPPGTVVSVVLGPPELDRPLALPARVLYSQDDGRVAQHRLEFLPPGPEEGERLEGLVLALLSRQRG